VALSTKDTEWAREQVATFKERRPGYEVFAATLTEVLEAVSKELAPLAIVGARAKTVASFGEKIWRKRKESPVDEFTDLCGARVITHTAEQVAAISTFIEEHFEIDRRNSLDLSHRLQPTEFGYRSVHYIVTFKGPAFATPSRDVDVPAVLLEMPNPRAEVQVRTILEHAWADIGHELAYKNVFELPPELRRELAGVAAVLEGADEDFSRIQEACRRYSATYDLQLSPEDSAAEMEKLQIVLDADEGNADVAARIGKLAIGNGNWDHAIEVLSAHVGSGHQPVVRDLGVAMCKKHAPGTAGYAEGQRHLERAVASPQRDVDSLASLAGTWKGIDESKAGELYRQAFELDPSDPYAAGQYIEHEIVSREDASFTRLLRPVLDDVIARCREQAAVGMNLPWAYYDMGRFHLLGGRPYDALAATATGLAVTSAAWMAETSLRSLDRLAVVSQDLPGYEWLRRLLLLGLATREDAGPETVERASDELRALASRADPIERPVIIVAGGCDESVRTKVRQYGDVVVEAFRSFEGTIVSGGTTQGIAGLAGDVKERNPAGITAIGYLPESIPDDEQPHATEDARYDEIRRTAAQGFTALEPLQNWIDLVASGIHPFEVKLLGVNGGTIAATEFRIALALGATVAVIEDSGREASGLLVDDDWSSSERLIALPDQVETVRAYVSSPVLRPVAKLPHDVRETLAQAIHENYRDKQKDRKSPEDAAMAQWDSLRDDLKDSNRQQADFSVALLAAIGRSVGEASDGAAPAPFSEMEIETMAELEHARWSLERLRAGWRWAESRDPERKLTPHLVAWEELPGDVREYDRETVSQIPAYLAAVGLVVEDGSR
jgi:ppGpp synthetase/RelA/SpoT-type nucleotidyltranferase